MSFATAARYCCFRGATACDCATRSAPESFAPGSTGTNIAVNLVFRATVNLRVFLSGKTISYTNFHSLAACSSVTNFA